MDTDLGQVSMGDFLMRIQDRTPESPKARRDRRYPSRNPRLAPIPGVELRFDPLKVNCWTAWMGDKQIARAPWKKLCWKTAKKYVEAMG